MDILFFDYGGDNRVINKAINDAAPLASVSGAKPFEPLSPLTGQLLLEYDATIYAANYVKFNGKYYFITDRELLTGGRMRLFCRVDVLKTYASAIGGLRVMCRRSGLVRMQQQYLPDEKYPVETRRKASQIENATDFAVYSDDMILITVG